MTAPSILQTLKPDEEFQGFFLAALEENRRKRDAERGDGRRTHFYVSEVGDVIGESACLRKAWYAWHGAPKDPLLPDTLMAFTIGDAIGLRVANIIAGTGKVERVELRMDFPDHPLSGRLDVLTIPVMRRVVEVKTLPHRAVGYIPKPEHIRQLTLYLYRIRQEEGFEDYDGTLAYFVKDPTKGQTVLHAFRVPYDEALALESLEAFHDALWVAEGDALPERPEGFTRSKFPCGYCSFKTHCWSGPITNGDAVPF